MPGRGSDLPVDGRGKRAALVVARFHDEIADRLVEGARAALIAAGVKDSDIDEYGVAGAFEVAPAIRQLLGQDPVPDLVIALGAVIRGETPHFDFVAGAAAEALQSLAVDANVAIGFGVLTTETAEQALARSDPAGLDKGGETARAALAQAGLYERLRESRSPVRGFRAS
ncbi:MAG TPA: 6,7-dimethyl-8-ribityllumazine synthase [Gemmatimonadota bacterium]|jgi:6,7-dimethyl-8-ribityllumazine synthase|nr:6,7-dimethyl-8-ribityllumazine synthase [Gemmatimonadota bacterium]